MSFFAQESAEERAIYFEQYAAGAGIPSHIVEKDFWVCWLLGRIFAMPELGDRSVFKGGTSLSKAFGAIHRFSEDIDLGVTPASLGMEEEALDDAPSGSKRKMLVDQLLESCAKDFEQQFQPALEKDILSILGARPGGENWLTYELEAATRSPVLWFHFPQSVPQGDYVAPVVKIEGGSLTDQRPTGEHVIRAMVAELAPEAYDDFEARVVALEFDKTFWEKATILHAEYHRPASQPFRDRFARHYSDFAALWRHQQGPDAAKCLDLLERVRLHKKRYYGSAWANYDAAKPGTLRLVPPDSRLPELRRDYETMRPMFLREPLQFEEMLAILQEAEQTLNGV
jgi:hypothetical protein